MEEMKLLIKSYTSEAVFGNVNRSIVDSQFEGIHNYLAAIIENIPNYCQNLRYSDYSKPLYRGVNPMLINVKKDYSLFSVGYWSSFSSTSKKYRVASEWSFNKFAEPHTALVFEIYTCSENYPQTNIDLPYDWSFHPLEQEVLLMPFFAAPEACC